MKKIIVFIIILNTLIPFFSENIPQPKNDQLYTEFTAIRTASYLKKPMESSGYIVMNGKNNFLFKQTKPVLIEVRKKDDNFTLKIKNNAPINISSNTNGDNIAFLFDDPENIGKFFNITKNESEGKDEFLIIPKNVVSVEKIIVRGINDKIETITIFFIDKSTIKYDFQKTKTGTAPDEKYF